MPGRLLRTGLILENMATHIQEADATYEIQSYLTQHVLIVLCAEVEQKVLAILEKRFTLAGDDQLTNFAKTTAKRCFRSLEKNELSRVLKLFDKEVNNVFNDLVDDSHVTRYNNAIVSRHSVAHETGCNVTFTELPDILVAAEEVLDKMEEALID